MSTRDRIGSELMATAVPSILAANTGTEAALPPVLHESDDALSAGTRVGEHIIQHEIGRGGCGIVYRAAHRILGRQVAIKVLHRDLAASPEMVERFVREARAVNRICHAGIVQIHDFGTLDDNRPYQVMELLSGTNLSCVLEVHGRLHRRDVLALFEPLCQALHAVHQAGMVHRDLKASNIMVETSPAITRVTLLDFGIAKLVEPGPGGLVTSQGRMLGTPQAMAPEQILGQDVDHRADIYALGVLLFQVLTGILPFRADDRTLLLEQHLASKPPRASEHAPVAPALDAVIARAMAKQPDARFSSAQAFLHALREAARGWALWAPQALQMTDIRPACAVHASARIAARGVVSGELLDRLGDLLDEIEQRLVAAGFAIVVLTRSTVLGVLVAERHDMEAACRRAIEAACAIAASHRACLAEAPEIELALCVHTDDITVRFDPAAEMQSPPPAAPASGALLDPRTWPAPHYDGQVYATAEIRAVSPDARLRAV